MARGKKGSGDNKEPETAKQISQVAPAKPSEVKEMISQTKLMNLLKAGRTAKKDVAEINGRFGEAVANAVENHNLERKSFGWIRQLDAMEPEKIADVLDNFEYYLDVSGIQKRRESVMRMDLKEKPAADDADPEDTNVTKFPAPAGTA
jgi:hypothetical protein